ncbi:MAG: hypothetical protein QXP17_02725, partial [Candidatus Jordarchaeales archaeon]
SERREHMKSTFKTDDTMGSVILLHVPRFVEAGRRAGEYILSKEFDALFIPLPEELSETTRCVLLELVEEGELWKEYMELTGASEPATRYLGKVFSPILNALKVKYKLMKFDVYCYHDVTKHIESAALSEKQLLLEFKCKATGKLFLNEWKQLLNAYLSEGNKVWESYEKLLTLLTNYREPVVITHSINTRFLRKVLNRWKVKVSYSYHYWRSPLEQLLVYGIIKGVNNIADDVLEQAVRQQIEYIDLILTEESVDIAHEKWSGKVARILVSKKMRQLKGEKFMLRRFKSVD